MNKRDYWFWLLLAVFITLALLSIYLCGCGDLLQAGGHVLKAGGETIALAGEHLTETGTKGGI